jgi:hypothetical protein
MDNIPYTTHDIAVSDWYYAGIGQRVSRAFKHEDMLGEHLVGEIIYAVKDGCGLRTGQFDSPFAYHLVKSCHSTGECDPVNASEDFVDFFFGLCDMLRETEGANERQ